MNFCAIASMFDSSIFRHKSPVFSFKKLNRSDVKKILTTTCIYIYFLVYVFICYYHCMTSVIPVHTQLYNVGICHGGLHDNDLIGISAAL